MRHPFRELTENRLDFYRQITFSNDARFWLSGYVVKQNCRFCGENHAHEFSEIPLHSQKVSV